MRNVLMVVMAAAVALVGCAKSDKDQVDAGVQNSAFFKALGGIPGASDGYTGHGGLDGDTSWPVKAWRVVKDPAVSYVINVERPYAEVSFTLAWPCTLFVTYTDLPDTSIRDTAVKPAPMIAGAFEARFAFAGDSWYLDQLSPCRADFDSAVGLLEVDSVGVRVIRAGQPVEYPTLRRTGRLPVATYPYTFTAGDSVQLRLWETHDDEVEFPWAYLHGPATHNYSPFQLDTLDGSWFGTWTIGAGTASAETRWVWFEVVDLESGIFDKEGPDRASLLGLFYRVE